MNNNHAGIEFKECKTQPESKREAREWKRRFVQTLASLHIDESKNISGPMEHFLSGFEVCDHTMSFDAAHCSLLKVDDHFAEIDKNRDGVVTFGELRDYANRHPECCSDVDWVLCHYEALTRASLLPHNAIQRGDLKQASRVFHGLAYVLQHFDSISTTGDEYQKIYPEDLLRLVCCREGLSPDEAQGIWHLIHYLVHLHRERSGKRAGLSQSQLKDISPEVLWSSF